MEGLAFKQPVVVWLDRKRADFGTKSIATVHEGMAALHRFGLGDCRLDEKGHPRREWALAAAALIRARMEPNPENAEAARKALCTLARLAGVLAPPPTRPSALQRAFTLFGAHG